MRLSDLDHWAQHHHGLITRHASGLSTDAWRRAIRAGSLIELHRHVARLPGSPTTIAQQIHAAVLAAGTGATASHRSAAALWQMVPPDIGGGIHITMSNRARNPRLDGVVIHRPTDRHRLDPHDRYGIACTNAVRTLCDLGADDPALVRPAVAAALTTGVVDVAALTVAVAEHARHGRGGIPALRSAVTALAAAPEASSSSSNNSSSSNRRSNGAALTTRQTTRPTTAQETARETVQTLKRNSITSPSWAT